MDKTRKLRRELGYGLAKLDGLQRSFESTPDEDSAKASAVKIREQAEICLHLLDQYQSSVPGRMWSDAERKCQSLREDLKRTGVRFRAASGEYELRGDERLAGRSWWSSTDLALLREEKPARNAVALTEQLLGASEYWIGETPIDTDQPIEVELNDLAFDPEPAVLTAEPAQMMTVVTILVGPHPDGGAEIFSATLCTPEWLATECEIESIAPGAGLLVVRSEDFDEPRIRREIERFLAGIHEVTWGDVVARIKEWFPHWEMDGYAS